MSYRGRPSKGCEACRARKVKCDETKPKCSRCSKVDHECLYRDQSDLLFRNQTASAAQRAEEAWRKRSKSHQRTLSEGSAIPLTFASMEPRKIPAAQATAATPASFESLSIPSPLRQDLRRLAYERFVYDFVASEDPNRPPEEPSDALFSFVPLLYQHAAPGSCLTTIVNAVAYINFANRCNAPQAATLAEENFGQGIRMLSSMITNTEQASSNDALCSVHLMGVFETLTNFQRQGTFAAHQHGANALLQLRTPDQYYDNHVSARLYEIAYAQMLLASLQAAKYPSLPLQDTANLRKYLPSLYNQHDTFVIRLIWREAQLHARWHDMKRIATPPICRYDLYELLQAVVDLDAEYQAWEHALPSAWRYETQPNTPEARSIYSSKWQKLVLTSRGAPAEVHTYSNLKRCSLWGYYRTSRIFLLRDILEILNWMLRLPATTPQTRTEESAIPSLHDIDLRTLQSSAMTRMISVIEQSCSVILGSFTVPMYKKSSSDVMGVRGHIVLWSLGIMDSVLSSGLVADYNTPSPSLRRGMSAPPTAMASFQYEMELDTQEYGFSSALGYRHTQHSPPNTPPATANRAHPFDSTPRHPYDAHVALSDREASFPGQKIMDVAAKRQWLNCMLYYIGTELGIKKALIVPHAEGYMGIVKPFVDSILGR